MLKQERPYGLKTPWKRKVRVNVAEYGEWCLIIQMRFIAITSIFFIFAFQIVIGEQSGDWVYDVIDGHAYVTGYLGTNKSVSIPTSFNNIQVISLNDHLFQNNADLVNVDIPDSIKYIGDWAFFNCQNIENITLGNGIESIGIWAFQYCFRLKNIEIPNSIYHIGAYAFYQCTNLISASIGSNLASIDTGVFDNCTKLKVIIFNGNAPANYGTWNNTPAVIIRPTAATGWGSSFAGLPVFDETSDSNEDGISNLQAAKLGYDPGLNFLPLINFLKTNSVSGNFFGLYTSSQIHNLGLGGIVLNRDTNNQLTLNYQILQSTDLQNWAPYQSYELPITNVPSDKMFLRVQAVGR